MTAAAKKSLKQKALDDFLCVRKRVTGQRDKNAVKQVTKTKVDAASKLKVSTKAFALETLAVARSATPHKEPAKELTVVPQHVTSSDAVASVSNPRKRKCVGGGVCASDPTCEEKGTAPATRRRLFADTVPTASQASPAEHDDTIGAALAQAAAERRRVHGVRSSKRDKFAHLLAGKKTVPEPRCQTEDNLDRSKSRFRYLLDRDKQSLKLPFKYQILFAKFLALETVCMIQSHCRGRTVTFDSAKASVERTCSKEFTMDDLARIMTVFPEAYKLELIHRHGLSPGGQRSTVTGYLNGRSALRISVDYGTDAEVDACMSERKARFGMALLDITKAAHRMFLSDLEPSVDLDGSEIKQWHPDFNVDQVPDIKRGELPQPPQTRVMSAAEVLSSTSNLSSTVKEALEHVVAKKSVPPSPAKKHRNSSPKRRAGANVDAPSLQEEAKPLSLRERIRLKERLTKEAKMKTEAETKGMSAAKKQYDVAMIIRAFLLSKRKNTWPFHDCVAAILRTTQTPIREAVVKETLHQLAVAVPNWCSIKKFNGVEYVAIVPNEFSAAQRHFQSQM